MQSKLMVAGFSMFFFYSITLLTVLDNIDNIFPIYLIKYCPDRHAEHVSHIIEMHSDLKMPDRIPVPKIHDAILQFWPGLLQHDLRRLRYHLVH